MGVAAQVTLRPGVAMGLITGVPYVAALGAAEALGARLAWPHDLAGEDGSPLASLRARAGYDDEGVFVSCELVAPKDEGAGSADSADSAEKNLDLEGALLAARARVDAWAADAAAGRATAGPLAPVLSDYFDALLGMGEEVEVVRGGRVIARGTLAGVDVWGRATVRLENGAQELEIAPEQATLRRV